MRETVPADIAVAIEDLMLETRWFHDDPGAHDVLEARRELEAAILTHLHKADELKATLDRIVSGGA